MRSKARIAVTGCVLALLVLAAPAAAAPQTKTYRTGPITIAPYQVKQSNFDLDIPKPSEDGYLTGMQVDVVDADGSKVPINRLMLHHIVFSNLGSRPGEKHDATCGNFTMLDSKTSIPAAAERFYARGEEGAKLRMPPGYGYKVAGKDRWLMTWMLMNHRATTDRAYIQYTLTYDTAPLKPVTPYWLDIKNCLFDPVFDIAGGKKKGATNRHSSTWTVPTSGRIVAAGGHVHGGAKALTLRRDSGRCDIYSSKPTWGARSHPFYHVRPILHEPGPIDMSAFTSRTGFAIKRGERLRLDADYDGELLHTRVMGIMIVFVAPDAGVKATKSCKPPKDIRRFRTSERGRATAPRFTVPLTGIGPNGKAHTISAPPGARKALRSGSAIRVADNFFATPNVRVRAGSVLKWDFTGSQLHNVTVADGPRGFSSVHLDGGRVYRAKLRTPGTYRLFCALHPVEMTETIKVTKK